MTVGEGTFQLYTHVAPPLKAGLYRFDVTQGLGAQNDKGALGVTDLPVEPLGTHVEVTSPRYLLPPDQVLSTFPPAGTEGSYGSRLPQVVIKRRTLPWERAVSASETTPWLALIVFTEAEATLVTNTPVADCVTSGVRLDGVADVQTGNHVQIRKSMVDRIMPTQKDIPLLAHAREVDLHDTELMMGDDDGFLAVVIANRLPVAGRTADGAEAPVKYTVALVSLEGQLDRLLPQAPPHIEVTQLVALAEAAPAVLKAAGYDHAVMGMKTAAPITVSGMAGVRELDGVDGVDRALAAGAHLDVVAVSDHVPASHSGTLGWKQTVHESAESMYVDMGKVPFTVGVLDTFDPLLRFPALLHWTFTTTGSTTFEKLMSELDSGLLGTIGEHPTTGSGRPPVEVVETGHVGLVQRTRRGDEVRAWYRGPLLPHPADLTADRLPLAHASDQLRAVIPDGREDLSLAAAFEVGRLLALSSPTVVAALMRWRQLDYQAARQQAVWGGVLGILDTVSGFKPQLGSQLARRIGLGLAHSLVASPDRTIGGPRPLVGPGTRLPLDVDVDALPRGLGIDATLGDVGQLLEVVRSQPVPIVRLSDLPTREATVLTQQSLQGQLSQAVSFFASDALASRLDFDPALGPTIPRGTRSRTPHRDLLDDLLDGVDESRHATTDDGEQP